MSRNIENSVEKQLLREAIDRLPEREREIMEMRFGLGGREEKTQKQVADMMGISQSYISRLEKKIIGRLKKKSPALCKRRRYVVKIMIRINVFCYSRFFFSRLHIGNSRQKITVFTKTGISCGKRNVSMYARYGIEL